MDEKQYNKYVSDKMKKSTIVKDTCIAFLVGGFICTVGQCIKEILLACCLGEKPAAAALTIILIFIGSLLTALGLYCKLGKFAGAGSIVPITGFANSVVSPAMEAKSEGLVLGVAAKMFTVAGPVIVYGTLSSFIVGIIFFLLKYVG